MNTATFANKMGYSDIRPYRVVRVISDKTMEVIAMDADLDPTWKPEFQVGGFVAHCSNQGDQRYINFRDAEMALPVRIRKTKKGWQDKHGHRYALSDKPVKFYDYNF